MPNCSLLVDVAFLVQASTPSISAQSFAVRMVAHLRSEKVVQLVLDLQLDAHIIWLPHFALIFQTTAA